MISCNDISDDINQQLILFILIINMNIRVSGFSFKALYGNVAIYITLRKSKFK